MSLIFRVVVGLVVAVIIYVVLTAFIVFNHSTLVFGLIALVIFLGIVFAWDGNYRRTRGGPPVV